MQRTDEELMAAVREGRPRRSAAALTAVQEQLGLKLDLATGSVE